MVVVVEPEEKAEKEIPRKAFDKESWHPRTTLGKKVKNGDITNIDDILEMGERILEAEIVDVLLPSLETDLLMIGQSKGKFGGGQRRVFRQTQKKTAEGNKPKFATYAVVGDSNGHVGMGFGKSRETVPAREKAIRNAKLNVMKVSRGCGSWQCGCGSTHSIPFAVKGRSGSVRITLMPAPKGAGLIVNKEAAKILKLAGIHDVWSSTLGQTRTTMNLIMALSHALIKLSQTKVQEKHKILLGLSPREVKEHEQ